jgi:histidine triad (HIT) family protein
VGEVCKMMDVQPGEGGDGFRAISNAGENGVQEVPHLHVHILGGRWLGRMLAKAE